MESRDRMDSSIMETDEKTFDGTENEEIIDSNNPSSKSVYGLFFNKSKFPGGLKKQAFFQNLRHQLLDQVKSLESRLESQLSTTSELADYFKKRAEIEIEIARMFEKMFNHKNKGRKETTGWSPGMLNALHLHLINDTKREAKERLVLSEICSQIVTRLTVISEDLQRIFKQCQLVCTEGQEELLKVLHELYTSSKSYSSYRQEWKLAEGKLKLVEAQKTKVEIGLVSKEKIEKSKKVKTLDKEILKRLRKTNDAKFKALKSKNEYILCLDAANACVQKYFVDDLSDLIDCMDLGYYESLGNALKLYVSSEETKIESVKSSIDTLNTLILNLDSRVDKQKFLEAHNSAFVLPKKFEVERESSEDETGPPGAQTTIITINEEQLETPLYLHEELEQRMHLLERRLGTLRMEANETWKTLETAETSLLNLIGNSEVKKDQVRDCFLKNDVSFFITNSAQDHQKCRLDRLETDQFHINKYRDYMLCTNRISRLEAKYEHIRSALNIKVSESSSQTNATTMASTNNSIIVASTSEQMKLSSSDQLKRRKRIGKCSSSVRLFGGSLEEYLETNKVQIPLIIRSCVRVLNLYGLHHQGLFRVSGSQLEIGNFRDAFERGEDPLAEMNDADINNASDINSVASLLKLYLRELREPLFPLVFFDAFMEIAQLDNNGQFISRMRDLVTKSLPRAVFVVLRYLFHFLNHLTEFSDEHCMDSYNLAICFGPTLVPVPEEKDQVQYQNLVNELIKNIIVYAHEIFINDGAGEIYEKHLMKNNKIVDQIDDEEEDFKQQRTISINSDVSEESGSVLFGTAQYDFKARSPRELSFRKGEVLSLVSQISSDWWKGRVVTGENKTSELGLIPHKYLIINCDSDLLTEPPPPIIEKISSIEEKQSPLTIAVIEHKTASVSQNEQEESGNPIEKVEEEKSVQPKESGTKKLLNNKTHPKPPPPQESSILRTPDLVMDLPHEEDDSKNDEEEFVVVVTASPSSKSSSPSPSSSSSSQMTTTGSISDIISCAEVFATQDQCTLKKPQVKVKPQVLAKPKLPRELLKEEEQIKIIN